MRARGSYQSGVARRSDIQPICIPFPEPQRPMLILHALPPSANSASTRALLKAAGIDFKEEMAYGKTREHSPTKDAP